MNETKTDFDLNMHTARLLMQEPFFASLSRRVTKAATTAIPTAGVRVNPETARFEMLYNPEFFAKLTDAERTAVLIHEFYHLIFQHVTDRKPWTGQEVKPKEARQWNIACDLAINSHIKDLPEMACKPGVGPFVDFESGLSAEVYLKLLKKKAEEQEEQNQSSGQPGEPGEDGEGSGTGDGTPGMPEDSFDSHDGWGEGDSTSTDIARERVKEYLKEAAKDAQNSGSGWGSVSQAMQREIIDRLSTKVDWKKVLRYFVKTSRRSNRSSTVKRVNKRYRYIHPGKKVQRRAKLAVSIDMSGSVHDGMMALFFSELEKLTKFVSVTVVPFDTRVEDSLVYEWKQGASHAFERVMCGGTDFNAPTKWVNDKGFDGHIILTDMAAPKPIASKCQRMWVTTQDCLRYQHFQTNERIIVVDK